MTLDSVCVDCTGAFQPGQISVGLGRVRDKDELIVKNYRPGLCPTHDRSVFSFYSATSQPKEPKLVCCKRICVSHDISPMSQLLEAQTQDECEDLSSENSDDSDDVSVEFSPPCNTSLPPFLSLEQFKDKFLFKNPVTDMQRDINEIVMATTEDQLTSWCGFIYAGLQNIASEKKRPLNSNKINDIVHQYLHSFPTTDLFQTQVKHTFNINRPSECHQSIIMTSLLRMQDAYFADAAQQACEAEQNEPIQMTDSNLAKVRYVAGMCVGRVLHLYTDYVCRNVHAPNRNVDDKKNIIFQLSKHLYDTHTIAEMETSYPASLHEIAYRKNIYGHLTIVDDQLFNVFLKFHQLFHSWLTPRSLKSTEAFHDILTNAMEVIMENEAFPPSLRSTLVLVPILTKYLKVDMKELGTRIASQHTTRKLAHGKQVIVEEASGGPSKTVRTELPSTSSGSIDPTTPTSNNPPPGCLCSVCRQSKSQKSQFLWIECTNVKTGYTRNVTHSSDLLRCGIASKGARSITRVLHAEGLMVSISNICNICNITYTYVWHGYSR